ncbi:MAG: hypothetical protein CMK89_23020 [Pseudomonadales bacterium]|nr:hypothetical protein [Pseudomonadales bacterium]
MGPLPEQFKVITKVIVVFTLLWSTTFSKAATDQNLFAGQYYLLELMTDVELYRKGQGQSDVYDQLTGHLQNFRTHFASLLATGSLPESDALSLQQQWKQVARNLSALLVTIRQGGFIDQEIRYQYQEQTSQFWRQLHGAALGQRELTGPEQVVLHLQLANLRYLEPQWRLAPHEESSLTAIAEQIDADVSELPNSPADFRKKWPLLRQALLQEGGAMSFIVNRYSGDLIALLLEDIQSKGR